MQSMKLLFLKCLKHSPKVPQITECIHSTVSSKCLHKGPRWIYVFQHSPSQKKSLSPYNHEDIFILTVYVCIGTLLGTFYSWYLRHTSTVF